jgi:hypothetical protein
MALEVGVLFRLVILVLVSNNIALISIDRQGRLFESLLHLKLALDSAQRAGCILRP